MTTTVIRETEVNNLAKAAQVLDGHWCKGDLVVSEPKPGELADPLDRGDKFCAVGALAWIIAPSQMVSALQQFYDGEGELDYYYMNEDSYRVVRESDEGLMLATVIAEHQLEKGQLKLDHGDINECDSWDVVYRSIEEYIESVGVDEIIFNFNDEQTEQGPVLDMMRLAAERLDAEKR